MAAHCSGPTPYTVDVPPDVATRMAEAFGTLLVLGVPQGAVFGIDQQRFVVGPRFKGVKMLPPGVHFIHYNAASLLEQRAGGGGGGGASSSAGRNVPHGGGGGAEFGPTTSFFLNVEPRQVVVRRWDPHTELLLEVGDEDEAARLAEGVRRFDFDSGLAPYDLRGLPAWRSLTSCLSADLAARLSPLPPGNICVLAEADPGGGTEGGEGPPATEAERALESRIAEQRQQLGQLHLGSQQQQPASTPAQHSSSSSAGSGCDGGAPDGSVASASKNGEAGSKGTGGGSSSGGGEGGGRGERGALESKRAAQLSHLGRCYYTQVPRLVKRKGLTPGELTALNLDKSALLEEVIAREYEGRGTDLIGELQFAFLTFLLGQSLRGFAQWKALMHLALGCEAAPLGRHARLFEQLLRALAAQLSFATSGDPHHHHQHQQQRAADQQREQCMQGGGRGGGGPGGGGGGSYADEALGLPLGQELLQDSFLAALFRRFFGMLAENTDRADPKLLAAAEELRSPLEAATGWDLSLQELGTDEDDEDGPVVVEL